MSILDRDSKHLFLEKQNNSGSSFVANVNVLAGQFEDILTVSHNIGSVVTVSDNIDNVNIVSEHIDNVDTVSENINFIDTISDNIEEVVICGDNIDFIKTVNNHIEQVFIVAPYVTKIDTVARNVNTINTVHSWNVPELARQIDVNRQTVDQKTASTLAAEAHAVQLVSDAQSFLNDGTERLEAIEDLDARMTSLYVSTANSIADNTLTIMNQTSRITKNKQELDSKYSELEYKLNTKHDFLSNKIDNNYNDIENRLEMSELETANAIAEITKTDLAQSARITEVDKKANRITEIDSEFDSVKTDLQNTKTNLLNDITTAKNNLNSQISNATQYMNDSITERMDEIKDKVNHFEDLSFIVEQQAFTSANSSADLVLTDLNQAQRITELDQKVTKNAVKESCDVVELVRSGIDHRIKTMELQKRFDEHQLNDCERFSDLSYASVVHTRHIQELDQNKLEQALTSCLSSAEDTLTNIQQSDRITKAYKEFKNLIVNNTNLTEETLAQYFDSLDTLEEISNSYHNLLNSNNALITQYQTLNSNYNTLLQTSNNLSDQYNQLVSNYNDIINRYNTLNNDHTALAELYTQINGSYNTLINNLNKLLENNGAIYDENGNVIGFIIDDDIDDLGVIDSWYG